MDAANGAAAVGRKIRQRVQSASPHMELMRRHGKKERRAGAAQAVDKVFDLKLDCFENLGATRRPSGRYATSIVAAYRRSFRLRKAGIQQPPLAAQTVDKIKSTFFFIRKNE